MQRVLCLRHRVQALLARPDAVVNEGPPIAGLGELDLLDIDGATALRGCCNRVTNLRRRRCMTVETLSLNLIVTLERRN